jgi:hypothetical protein
MKAYELLGAQPSETAGGARGERAPHDANKELIGT